MRRLAVGSWALFLGAFLAFPPAARALFHEWQITEVYSNADGSVQYVEFFTDTSNQQFLQNHDFTSDANTFTFLTNLPVPPPTANRHFLIATPAFASQEGAVTPDYTFASGAFFSVNGDTITFDATAVDVWTIGPTELPIDGENALHEAFDSDVRSVAMNSPTNFAGEVGMLPEPAHGAWVALLCLAALSRWRARERA